MGRDHSIECEHCGKMRGGLNDLMCDCDYADCSNDSRINRLLIAFDIEKRLTCLAHNILWGAVLAYEHESAIQEDRAIARGEFQPMCACGHQADRWGREECPACWEPGCGKAAP
jgi:hypothetical protein